MRRKRDETTADKLMIAVLESAIAPVAALEVFDVVSMATHTFHRKAGIKAPLSSAILVLICYRALRKRMDGFAK